MQSYPCQDLYQEGFADLVCKGKQYRGLKSLRDPVRFDRTYTDWNVRTFVVDPVMKKFNVPVFVNQWGIAHGIKEEQGRFAYMKDVARTLQQYNIGWTWWTWQGGSSGDAWSNGSMEIVYKHVNGTLEVDQKAVDALKGYIQK